MAETYESKINSEHVQGWTRRTVADGDYLQSKTIQPLVNRDSILAKGLDDTNTLINGMSDKVDDVETKCNAQEALVKSLSGDVEDFCTSATEAFEQIKANEQTLAGNVEGVQQSVKTLSGDIWNMNFMGFKDSTTVFVKEEIEQGKHMFSFSSVGGGGGGTSYDMAWYPSINDEGNMSWQWLQTTIAPTTKKVIPDFTISDYHLYYTYADQPASTDWIDLGNIRGPQGQQGSQGPAGANACALTATSESVTDGTQVTISYTSGGNVLAQFTVNDGQKGADGSAGANACPISAKSTTTGKTHNVKIFYTSAANPDTNPLADFNVLDGQDGQGSSYVFDNTTMSGNGSQQTPYGVDTDVLATHTWVEDQHYIANVYDIVGNNGVSAEKDTANNQYIVGLSGRYVNVSGDTMTGPLVVNSTTNHPIVGISQRGDSDDFAVFGATRKKSNNNFGTTWLGVGQDGQGVLKNIPNTTTSAATEPASNGAYTQITFSQDNNAVPSIDINAKLNGDNHNYKSVVVPQQSYNSMSSFDATNGPNYMLRKLNNGSFDIGACVINVTEVPTATEANTYYFVYDLV